MLDSAIVFAGSSGTFWLILRIVDWFRPHRQPEPEPAPVPVREPAAWAKVVNATIRKHIREAETNILQNRKLTASIKERGVLKFSWANPQKDGREIFMWDGEPVRVMSRDYLTMSLYVEGLHSGHILKIPEIDLMEGRDARGYVIPYVPRPEPRTP